MDALPVKVTLTLPPGARVLPERVHPQPTRQAGASLKFDLALDQDQQIKVEFVQPMTSVLSQPCNGLAKVY